jgi:hypothetical protein
MRILRRTVSRAAAQQAHFHECDEHTGQTAREMFPQHVQDRAIVDLVRYFLGEISEEKSNEERSKAATENRSRSAEPGVAGNTSRTANPIPHGSER